MKTIGIIGSRRRNNEKDLDYLTKVFLRYYDIGDEIVSGGCSCGADRFAEVIAKRKQIPIKIYYAEWNRLGVEAGFIRNTYIAHDSDLLIAVVAMDRTGGTEDTIKKYLKMDKPLILIYNEEVELINFKKEDNFLDQFK
jgi:hypothetical protein